VQAPIFTGCACEGGSTLFEVKYFGDKAYLTQSWQLYAEAMIQSLEKIYTIAPSFRAEKSRTKRHLTEYWHQEMESAWMGHEELMEFEEDLILYVIDHILKHCEKELKDLGRDISKLKEVKKPFLRITYKDAVEKIGKKWGDEITDKEEKELLEKLGDKPTFLTSFPRDMKAFYMRPDPKDPKVVLASDLLVPGIGEIIGGSERIYDMKELLESMKIYKLDKKHYEWYLDLRRFGTVPHSGFGMGIERLVMWIAGIEHIMDTIPFPRTMDRVTP
jgi:asparaginyl-tRNA synthetase